MKRRIAIVTVGRSDYGIFYPLLKLLQHDPDCDLRLIVTGAHLLPQFGNTVEEIEKDGIPIAMRVPVLVSGDSRETTAMSIGLGVINFTTAYTQLRPDIVVVLGDRFETLAAAVAALPLQIVIAHLHGGEVTKGAIDDAIRHAITKLSHLHFASSPAYARRLEQMGEEPQRIFVTGSPIIDTVLSTPPLSKAELEAFIGLPLEGALLVTYHPETLAETTPAQQISEVLAALEKVERPLIFTYPNSDPGNAVIVEEVRAFVDRTPRARLFFNIGHQRYHNLQRYVAAMAGNSSSGMVEAAAFHLPVVNIGERQAGRVRTANIIDVPTQRDAIESGLRRALTQEFRDKVTDVCSPFGKGTAAQAVVDVIKRVPLDGSLLAKTFRDLPIPEASLSLGVSK
jgi:GDP/UDP-N,N'-diacetylbacillosamine 2-epimerase (hydrolysing)